MKVFVQVSMVFVLALIGLGSALQCYNCVDYTGSCNSITTCPANQDGCLTLKARNGNIYRQCIKFSDCSSDILQGMFPTLSKFSYDCCHRDLCNSASVSAARTSVIALLLSLALFWWYIF